MKSRALVGVKRLSITKSTQATVICKLGRVHFPHSSVFLFHLRFADLIFHDYFLFVSVHEMRFRK